jgi:NAD(P)-dependent dehydrogenase (short-subunit alcohol dehydrogenase family)
MIEIATTDLPPDQRPKDWIKRSTIEGFMALIVGGGSGMGFPCAGTFTANDGLAMVADLRVENAKRVAAEIVETATRRRGRPVTGLVLLNDATAGCIAVPLRRRIS